MPTIPPLQKLLALCTLSLLLAGCDQSEVSAPAPELSFAESFQEQLIQAQPGDVIEVPAGVHKFTRSLSLTVPGVTIRVPVWTHRFSLSRIRPRVPRDSS